LILKVFNFFIFLSFFFRPITGYAEEVCSRVALVNYQEVLVDTSSAQKGEGLRFYLEKDLSSKELLDKYQKDGNIKWQNAFIGSSGSLLLLSSLFLSTNKETKKNLRFSGFFLLIINFLLANSYDKANEKNLVRAIEEYNKRNLPRIEFPIQSMRNGCCENEIVIGQTWSF